MTPPARWLVVLVKEWRLVRGGMTFVQALGSFKESDTMPQAQRLAHTIRMHGGRCEVVLQGQNHNFDFPLTPWA